MTDTPKMIKPDHVAMNIICVAFAEIMTKDDVKLDQQVDAANDLVKELSDNGFKIVKTNADYSKSISANDVKDLAQYVLKRAPMATARIMQLGNCAKPCGKSDCSCALCGMMVAIREYYEHD